MAALVIVVGPARLLYVLAHIRPLPALLMAPVAVAISVARAVSWSFALRAVGIDITVGCAVQVVLAARPMVFLPAGDLARVAVLEATTEHRYGAGRAAATVVFQELTFMTLLGIAIVPVLVLYPQLVSVAVLLAGLAAAIFIVLLWEPAYHRAVRLTSCVPLLRRFEQDLVELRPSFLQLFNWHTALGVFAFAAVALGLTFLLFQLALQAVGVEHISFLQAASIYAVAYLVSAITMTPVGMGAYEGILTGFMVLQGVSPPVAAGAAILYRGFNDIFLAGLGLIFLVRLPAQGRHAATARLRSEN